MKTALRNAYALLLATLREIFDENAYGRYLARERLVPSRTAYRRWMLESEAQRQCRPRCC